MSPIIGLSDRGLAFPEIGQIRKGAPKPEKGIGRDLEYFRVDFDAREVDAIATFNRIYPGGKPTDLNIVLPFNSIEGVWDAWLEAYTAGRLVARADGEKFIYLVDTKTGGILVRNGLDANGNVRPYTAGQVVGRDYKDKDIRCKATGRLKVVLPELQRLAYLTVLTGSLNDIANISAQLLAIQTFCAGMGKGLGGTPLVLRRRPHEVSCPDPEDKSKRVRRTKWLLSVEADPEFVKAALLETKRLALPGNGLALPAPKIPIAGPDWDDIEDPEEEELVGEVTEAPKQPEAPKAPVAAVDHKPQPNRPWSPAQVKARISELVLEYSAKPVEITAKDRELAAATIQTTFNGDQHMRYAITRWLFDTPDGSTKGLYPAQIKALLTWQGIKAFGEVPSIEAIEETKGVYAAVLDAETPKKLL